MYKNSKNYKKIIGMGEGKIIGTIEKVAIVNRYWGGEIEIEAIANLLNKDAGGIAKVPSWIFDRTVKNTTFRS